MAPREGLARAHMRRRSAAAGHATMLPLQESDAWGPRPESDAWKAFRESDVWKAFRESDAWKAFNLQTESIPTHAEADRAPTDLHPHIEWTVYGHHHESRWPYGLWLLAY